MTRFDRRRIWGADHFRYQHIDYECNYPMLSLTIRDGPEAGRRVQIQIDPAEVLAAAQRMLDERSTFQQISTAEPTSASGYHPLRWK
jgi:hypothetical protein